MKKLFGIKFGRSGNSSGPLPRNSQAPGISNAEILPPFGTKEPVMLNAKNASRNLDERLVQANPFDGFYLTLPAKLRPQQIVNILRSAQGGDVWQLSQLHDLALTMWPMYKKCCCELKEAVSSVKFDVHPYCEEGEEPTPTAKEKADFVRRCLRNMTPEPSNDERDFKGTIYHLTDILFMGVGLQEIIWNKPRRGPFGYERTPKATTFIHPRHFTYTQDGFLTVFDENYSRYQFNQTSSQAVFAPDKDRFICGQYYSHGSSPLSSGLIRPLGLWLSIATFNREWQFNFAQKHGAPFMDATYAPGTPKEEVQKLSDFLAKSASQGFCVHVEGTTITVHPPHAAGADNPQRHLAEEADKQCQLLILGQTLTTDVADSGSRALGDVHMDVRSGKIEAVAKWLAHSPLNQLARAILRVNYGNEDECPHISPDFSKPLTSAEKATLITAIGNCPLPLLAEEVYKLLNFQVPEEGDKVVTRGKLGELGPTDDEVSALGLPGVEEVDQQLELQEQQAKIAKKYAAKPTSKGGKVKASELRRVLEAATPDELVEIKSLIVKAKEAPHLNGEMEALQVKISHVAQRTKL